MDISLKMSVSRVNGQDLLIWVFGIVQNVVPKQYRVVPESGVHVVWMNNKYVVWRTYKVLGWTSK